jgi:dienelactone hydrolase
MMSLTRRSLLLGTAVTVSCSPFGGSSTAETLGQIPQTVHFPSKDGAAQLTGFLYRPVQNGRAPVIVMMHGRAGAYSSLAKGRYDATKLLPRHKFWGDYWAGQGYDALLVDSFSARGFPAGFPIHSYGDRPDAVNEVTVRPLDAYGALAYLKSRADIDGNRIALMGWSNGGSATLATMADVTLDQVGLKPADAFRGALAFYPACGLHDRFDERYKPYAPVRVFGGDQDEEVSAAHCAKLVKASQQLGSDIDIRVYPGATHDFDDPGTKRRSVPANLAAAQDAIALAREFMAKLLAT